MRIQNFDASRRIVAQIEMMGKRCDDLDELVLDVAEQAASGQGNEQPEAAADSTIESWELRASEANNAGLAGQVDFIFACLGTADGVRSINRIIAPGMQGVSIGDYVLCSEQEQGYWASDTGWISQPEAATGFSRDEVLVNLGLSGITKRFVPGAAMDTQYFWTKSPDKAVAGTKGFDWEGPYPTEEAAIAGVPYIFWGFIGARYVPYEGAKALNHEHPAMCHDENDQATILLRGLVDWQASMGGFEAPIWRDAERLLARLSSNSTQAFPAGAAQAQ